MLFFLAEEVVWVPCPETLTFFFFNYFSFFLFGGCFKSLGSGGGGLLRFFSTGFWKLSLI